LGKRQISTFFRAKIKDSSHFLPPLPAENLHNLHLFEGGQTPTLFNHQMEQKNVG